MEQIKQMNKEWTSVYHNNWACPVRPEKRCSRRRRGVNNGLEHMSVNYVVQLLGIS